MTARTVHLQAIVSPGDHVHEIVTRDFTFMGDVGQPDFGTLTLTFEIAHKGRCPELKSLKLYLHEFRQRRMSYERVVETLWRELNAAYQPEVLRVDLKCSPRGGLSSRVWTEFKAR